MDFIGLIVAHGYWIVLAVAFVDQFWDTCPAIAILLTARAVAGKSIQPCRRLGGGVGGHSGGRRSPLPMRAMARGPAHAPPVLLFSGARYLRPQTETSFQRLGWKALVVAKFVQGWPSLRLPWRVPSGCLSRRSSSSRVSAVSSITWSSLALASLSPSTTARPCRGLVSRTRQRRDSRRGRGDPRLLGVAHHSKASHPARPALQTPHAGCAHFDLSPATRCASSTCGRRSATRRVGKPCLELSAWTRRSWTRATATFPVIATSCCTAPARTRLPVRAWPWPSRSGASNGFPARGRP